MPELNFADEYPSTLPLPTNVGLRSLFAGIDRVQLKDDGVYHDKALSENVVLTITDRSTIDLFVQLLEIEEPTELNACMCLGSHAIELYSGNDLKATIGLHHGTSVRYHEWAGDAELLHKEKLSVFLGEQGLIS